MLKKKPFVFPFEKSVRTIMYTDCNNECDDQYSVVHALMTPRFDVKAVISAHYFGIGDVSDTEQKSYDEIVKLATLMDIRDEVNVLHGSVGPMPDENTPVDCEGVRFIIEEAMKDDPRPLFVSVLGPITSVASALLMKPEIAERMTVIWIGGNAYPEGGWEPNQCNDINASRVVFKSKVELWQVPSNVYKTMKISFFEMLNRVWPCGAVGKYLVENTMRVVGDFKGALDENGEVLPMFPNMTKAEAVTEFGGEVHSLGDSPVIGLMLSHSAGRFHWENAPGDLDDDGRYNWSKASSRKIRVYDDIDSHFILNDMFEKLQFYFG